MRTTRSLILSFLAATALSAEIPAQAADALLRGTITSSAGEKMGGVTVSAKPEGGTITTTVFTDEGGNYYFPPLPSGKYRVWAQTLSFQTAKGEVDLSANRKQDFTLAAMATSELTFKQLPGNLVLAALPEETQDDQRMKRIVRSPSVLAADVRAADHEAPNPSPTTAELRLLSDHGQPHDPPSDVPQSLR